MSANTVKTPVSDRPIRDEDDLVPWANKECIPLLRDLRAAANYQLTYKVDTVSEGTATNITAWESERVPDNGAWLMEMRYFAVSAGGSQAVALRNQHWKFVAGVGSLVFSNSPLASVSGFATLPTFSFDATTQAMRFVVKDDGTVAHFSTIVRIQEIKL